MASLLSADDPVPSVWPSPRCYSIPDSRKKPASNEESEVSDHDSIDLLHEAEALEMVEVDHLSTQRALGDAPKLIESFIEKHFNCSLSELERKATMKDLLKPSCKVLDGPKLDE